MSYFTILSNYENKKITLDKKLNLPTSAFLTTISFRSFLIKTCLGVFSKCRFSFLDFPAVFHTSFLFMTFSFKNETNRLQKIKTCPSLYADAYFYWSDLFLKGYCPPKYFDTFIVILINNGLVR